VTTKATSDWQMERERFDTSSVREMETNRQLLTSRFIIVMATLSQLRLAYPAVRVLGLGVRSFSGARGTSCGGVHRSCLLHNPTAVAEIGFLPPFVRLSVSLQNISKPMYLKTASSVEKVSFYYLYTISQSFN